MEYWLAFVVGAVVSWGVYVPVLHEGQQRMGQPPGPSGALRSFLCVGIAYFVTAVLVPVVVLAMNWAGGERLDFRTAAGELKTDAIAFATLGGIAGAAGALCIIFAIKNGGKPLYVAPLVFAGAPIVNSIVSLVWHWPSSGINARGLLMFCAGILLAAVGAGLVLYSKGYIDQEEKKVRQARAKAAASLVAEAPLSPATPADRT
jgi:uncharacterized membrane protein